MERSIIINVEITAITGENVRQTYVRERLAKRLEKRFGKNEPIFMKEIIEAWSEYSESSVYKTVRELCEDGMLMKKVPGVYYIPEETAYGEGELSLDTMTVVEKRYIKNGGKVLGYYSGQTLMNKMGLSDLVPDTDEIVTVNETTTVRTVMIDGSKVKLRRAKIKINEKNAPVMQLLEIFNRYDGPLTEQQRDDIAAMAGGKIDKDVLKECAKYFPRLALQNLRNSGLFKILL